MAEFSQVTGWYAWMAKSIFLKGNEVRQPVAFFIS
jgi:hypothetical protein